MADRTVTLEELELLGQQEGYKPDDLDFAELDRIKAEQGEVEEIEGETPPEEKEPETPPAEKPKEGEEETKPTEETPPAEKPPVETPPVETPPTETPPTNEKPISRRESRRIQDLLKKYPEPTAAPTTTPAATTTPVPPVNGLNYEEVLDATPEVVKQFTDDRERAAREAYEAGVKSVASTAPAYDPTSNLRFETRLEIESPRVMNKYPILDRDAKEFDPKAAEDLNLMYLNLAGFTAKDKPILNPDFRYEPFMDAMFDLANQIADQKAEVSTKNIAKQAATTALRPDGSKVTTKRKDPMDMNDEEFNKFLGIA